MCASRPATPARQEDVGRRLLEGVEAVEEAAYLDAVAERLTDAVGRALARPGLRDALRGRWLGHSFHPLLTDFTEGAWMAASFLDLFGPRGSGPAARRLLGFGLLTAVPTYLSGLVNLTELRDPRERRVAVAHAATSSLALLLYARSYASRVRGARGRGTWLGVAGGVVALADGYLGGHLGHVRGAAGGETSR